MRWRSPGVGSAYSASSDWIAESTLCGLPCGVSRDPSVMLGRAPSSSVLPPPACWPAAALAAPTLGRLEITAVDA
jgi:hypothetical protein